MPHINKIYDFTVSVFIVFEAKVLLVHHPKYDKWIPMGGHIELDETPDEALFREIKEETALEVEILSTKPSFTTEETNFTHTPQYVDIHLAGNDHKHIAMVYFAKAKSNKHRSSKEHLAIHWLTENDLDNQKYKLSRSVKFYCKEALKVAGSAQK